MSRSLMWLGCGIATFALGCGPAVESSPGSMMQRWTVGGELVRSETDFWIHGGGCRVHKLVSTTGRLETITAPDGCTEIRILDDRLAFKVRNEEWQVTESSSAPALELKGDEVILAMDHVLHLVGTQLIDPVRRRTLPVAGRIEAMVSGQMPYLHTVREPDGVAITTLIDHDTSGLRLRWFYLDTASVEPEAQLVVVPPGVQLAAFDRDSVILLQPDHTLRTENLANGLNRPGFPGAHSPITPRPSSWTFHSRYAVVAVELTPHFVFVDSLVEPGIHEVHALDPANGANLWTQRVHAVLLRLFPYDQRVVWARDRVVAQIDVKTGRELWTWTLLGPPRSVQRMSDDVWLASGSLMGTEMFRIDPPHATAKSSL